MSDRERNHQDCYDDAEIVVVDDITVLAAKSLAAKLQSVLSGAALSASVMGSLK